MPARKGLASRGSSPLCRTICAAAGCGGRSCRRGQVPRGGGRLRPGSIRRPEALVWLRTVSRIIADSPALVAREQQAMSRTADCLAALLAAETGAAASDLGPQVAANALMGIQRADRLRAPPEPIRR